MTNNNSFEVRKLTKSELQKATLVCGVSIGKIMFAMVVWLMLLVAVLLIVNNAPQISVQFKQNFSLAAIGLTLLALIFSRPTEGWPSVIVYQQHVGLVSDPSKREFVLVPVDAISHIEQSVIMPNKSVLLVSLKSDIVSAIGQAQLSRLFDVSADDKISVLTHQSKKQTETALAQLQDLLNAR